MKFSIYILLIHLFLVLNLTAQENIHEQLRFRTFTANDGLLNNEVGSVCQDKYGRIWVGTATGINYFDGYNFETYIPIDKNRREFFDVEINVFADSRGNIYSLGSETVSIYNFSTQVFHPILYKNSSGLRFNEIFEDDNGHIWIFQNPFVFRYHPDSNSIDSVRIPKHLTIDFPIKSICFDGDEIYIGSRRNGLALFNQKTKQHAKFVHENDNSKSISGNYISSMLKDQNGNLWLGTFKNNGVNLFHKSDSTFTNFSIDNDNPSSNKVKSIFEDSKGDLWFGTRAGLYKLNADGSFLRYAHKDHPISKIKYNSVSCIYEDNQAVLWVGTNGGGLSSVSLNRKTIIHYEANKKDNFFLNDPSVQCFAEDHTGNILVGTEYGGLNIYNPKKERYTYLMPDANNPNSLRSKDVRFIGVDKNNNYWIGMYGGVDIYNTYTKQFYHLNEKDGFPEKNKKSRGILIDSENNIWIALPELLSFKKPGFDFKKISNETFHEITEIAKGQVIAIKKHRLNNTVLKFNFETEKFENFIEISSDLREIYDFIVDSDSNYWFARKGGLTFYNSLTKEEVNYLHEDGLLQGSITGVIEDNSRNIWISNSKGLCVLKRDSLSLNGKFRIYSVADGLQDKQFKEKACFKDDDGDLFFGGINGFNVFNSDEIKDNMIKPNVIFTKLKIFNKEVKINDEVRGNVVLEKSFITSDELTFSHKQSVFTIEFAAISYISPEQNLYAYMLEGIEDEWNYVNASRRFATYSSLPPGSYVFKVKAANNDGIWNNEPSTINITIHPPWWKTWWFKTLLFLLVAGSATSFYLIRINQIENQKIYLENQVAIRTHELKEANVNLQSKQEEILAQNEEIQQQSEEITAQRDEVKEQNEEIKSQKEQVSKAYDNIKIISEFGQKITSTLNLQSINSMIYNYVKSLMDVSSFGIGIYSNSRNQIEYTGYMEDGKILPLFKNDMSDENSLPVWCLINNKEIIIKDYNKDYKKYIKGEIPVYTKKRPESFLYVPLVVDKNKIGVMTAQSLNKNAFTNTDLTNLQSLASYISIALENANFYNIVNRQNQKITSSIEYAKNIQDSILPIKENMDEYFENFALYRPKDIVSGDFYWFTSVESNELTGHDLAQQPAYQFISVIDCTGHGVPGAFMSLIANRVLNDIVNQQKIYDTAKILEYLNIGVQLALKQEQTNNNDGMDLCMVRIERINKNKTRIMFSGAKRPLYYAISSDSDIRKLDSDRRSIGGIRSRKSQIKFTTQEMELNNGSVLYLTSDGIVDQNSPTREKFGTKRFLDLLDRVKVLSLYKQQEAINTALMVHMDEVDQRDDITVVGVKL